MECVYDETYRVPILAPGGFLRIRVYLQKQGPNEDAGIHPIVVWEFKKNYSEFLMSMLARSVGVMKSTKVTNAIKKYKMHYVYMRRANSDKYSQFIVMNIDGKTKIDHGSYSFSQGTLNSRIGHDISAY